MFDDYSDKSHLGKPLQVRYPCLHAKNYSLFFGVTALLYYHTIIYHWSQEYLETTFGDVVKLFRADKREGM